MQSGANIQKEFLIFPDNVWIFPLYNKVIIKQKLIEFSLFAPVTYLIYIYVYRNVPSSLLWSAMVLNHKPKPHTNLGCRSVQNVSKFNYKHVKEHSHHQGLLHRACAHSHNKALYAKRIPTVKVKLIFKFLCTSHLILL